MKKIELIDVVIVILTIVVFALIIQFLFGHSPTEVQITFGLFTFLSGFMVKLYFALYKLNREFGEFKIRFENVEQGLIAIKTKLKVR